MPEYYPNQHLIDAVYQLLKNYLPTFDTLKDNPQCICIKCNTCNGNAGNFTRNYYFDFNPKAAMKHFTHIEGCPNHHTEKKLREIIEVLKESPHVELKEAE